MASLCMATEYDPRRPRLPADLAGRIDAVRGDVAFNRWVVRALEEALGAGSAPSDPGEVSPRVARPAPPRAPDSKPEPDYVLPKIAPRRDW